MAGRGLAGKAGAWQGMAGHGRVWRGMAVIPEGATGEKHKLQREQKEVHRWQHEKAQPAEQTAS